MASTLGGSFGHVGVSASSASINMEALQKAVGYIESFSGDDIEVTPSHLTGNWEADATGEVYSFRSSGLSSWKVIYKPADGSPKKKRRPKYSDFTPLSNRIKRLKINY